MSPLLTLLVVLLGTPSGNGVMDELGREMVQRAAAAVAPAPSARRTPIGAGWVLYTPSAFQFADDGSYDVVIHFHGISDVVERQFEGLHLNALLVSVNLGTGSMPYRIAFAEKSAWQRQLQMVQESIAALAPAKHPHLRRLAISAWSAGHGAVLEILEHPEFRARIDAVMIADGMHGTFSNVHQRVMVPESLAPFIAFARDAAAGDKMMIVTHSAIPVPTYASTTESCAYLADALGGLEERPAPAAQTSRRVKGKLTVIGMPGSDAPAHALHLKRLASLTLLPLVERWSE
jgi:hypothetical protein